VTGPAVPARPPWPTRWPEVNRAVARLRDGAVEALGDRLVGLYLHGSLALGDFYPPASDIDFHAATAAALDAPAVERLGAMHAAFKAEGGWPARLEGVYLPVAALRRREPSGDPAPTVGVDWDLRPGRPGPTWVLDRWVTREHGVIVTGPDPRDLIDPITSADLRAAVLAALLDWARQLAEGADTAWLRPRNYQAFAVLTMCRALHVLERGAVVPKPEAAAWAMRHLPPPWPAQVERAMAWRADEQVDDRHLPETLRLVADTAERARAAG
jgi:Domain of unknown function (DUF4111)